MQSWNIIIRKLTKAAELLYDLNKKGSERLNDIVFRLQNSFIDIKICLLCVKNHLTHRDIDFMCVKECKKKLVSNT